MDNDLEAASKRFAEARYAVVAAALLRHGITFADCLKLAPSEVCDAYYAAHDAAMTAAVKAGII